MCPNASYRFECRRDHHHTHGSDEWPARRREHDRTLLLGARFKIDFWRVLSPNSPTRCSAKNAVHGSRLRARRGGPVRGHPRESILKCTLKGQDILRADARVEDQA